MARLDKDHKEALKRMETAKFAEINSVKADLQASEAEVAALAIDKILATDC